MHSSEKAGTCHDCGIVGAAGERWGSSDTCDACAHRYATRKWSPSAPLPPHGAGPNYPSSRCGCTHFRRVAR